MKKSALEKAAPLSERGSSDPRALRTREVVLAAAAELMHERGFGGCTIDALIERTGVAKTTIYRHWPGRAELLADTVNTIVKQRPLPNTGTVRGDLVEYFTLASHEMEKDRLNLNRSLATIAGLIEAAKRDPALTAVSEQMVATIVQTVRDLIARGKVRGEIARKRDVNAVSNLIIGAIFVQRAFLNLPLTDKYVIEIVDTFLEGARPGAR